jgi:cellulose synthase/poly-beta-1,6-N-acetylglucosamine synthase-like glycosyltransferase
MPISNHLFDFVFWACLLLVIYSYVLYPVLIVCFSRLFGRDQKLPASAKEYCPPASLLIAAHNEEAVIESRIVNALQTDYPADRLEIAVASDGSADATAAIVRRFQDPRVKLFDYAERRGKAATLNATLPQLAGEVVILSDANTAIDPQAVARLVRWFHDPQVGVVCGKLLLQDGATTRNADGLYWKLENLLKTSEARLGGLLGANGAIYAIRRAWFQPIPSSTIIDDFVLPLRMRLQHGCAIRYDRDALAFEETSPDVWAEFRRRLRIGAGGFQSLAWLRGLLWPGRGWIAFTFFSHKVLRWLCPFFLLGTLFSNLFLLGQVFYQVTFLGQLLFYLASLGFTLFPTAGKAFRPLRLLGMFTLMNGALMVGFFRWFRGTQKAAWTRTPRHAPSTRG